VLFTRFPYLNTKSKSWPLQLTASLLLSLRSKLLECIQIHLPQSTILGCLKNHLRHGILTNSSVLVCRESLQPSRCAETPFATFFQTNNSKIISLRCRVVEEVFCDNTSDCVVPEVLRSCSTVAISIEASYRLVGEEFERLFEDCQL